MTNEEIRLALANLMPEAKYSLAGDDYADIVWVSAEPKPTKAAIEAEIALLPAKLEQAAADRESSRNALLAKLGITAEEAMLLLGAN